MSAIVEIFRILATFLTVLMFLSPIPTIRNIHKTKSIGHMPLVPLVAMVSNAHVWMVYGWLAQNIIAIFATSAFGMTISAVYVSVYYRYTLERGYANRVMAVFACVMLINTVYPILGANGYTNQSYNGVRLTVGYIAATSSIVMYTSPFEKIRLVFKHKSGVFIPIDMVVVGSINSATWVVFSLLEIDWQVFTPNAILLVIGLLQIALYWVYNPATHPLQSGVADELNPSAKDLEMGRSTTTSCALSPSSSGVTPGTEHTDGDTGFVALRSPA